MVQIIKEMSEGRVDSNNHYTLTPFYSHSLFLRFTFSLQDKKNGKENRHKIREVSIKIARGGTSETLLTPKFLSSSSRVSRFL